MAYRLVSSDDHLIEPPDLWQARVPAKYRDASPKVVTRNGEEYWEIGGKSRARPAWYGCIAGRTAGYPKTFAELRPGVCDPHHRLEDMDADGVDVQVLFPNAAGLGGQALLAIADPAARMACIRAYNDYAAREFCAANPARLVPQCIVPLWSAEAAAEEVRRCAGLGHRGVVFSAEPQSLGVGVPHFNDPYWDPLWDAAQAADMPVDLHIGSGGNPGMEPWQGFTPQEAYAFIGARNFAANVTVLANLLFSGVLDRFPWLKFISVESGIGYVPYLLEVADHQYAQGQFEQGGRLKMLPSQYFRRQVYVSTWFERFGVAVRDTIGLGNILWECDYPHPTGTFPNSWQFIERSFAGVPEADRYQVLAGNALRVFHLS